VKYNPSDASNVIPAGIYDASIRAVLTEKDDGTPLRTKAGDDMQKVVWTVYTDRGDRTFSEYHAGGKMLWRYKKLAQAFGAEDAFKAGTFDAHSFVGENVQLELEVEENGQYGEQNRVAAYFPKRDAAPTGAPKAKAPAGKNVNAKGIPLDPTDDDGSIPF
jgi:hypothetical protein